MGTRALLGGGAVALTLWAAPALAQDDSDPGFLGRQIENALSGPGREVRVQGFEGALSGRATMQSLTIADAEGVWLTLEDAVLDWSRAALLRGRLSVDELSAERIEVARPPLPAPAEDGLPEAPDAEASGFSLPELPVTVRIGALSVAALELGEPILGEAATFSLEGRLRLEDGEGETALALTRQDGTEDRITLDAGFDNETRELAVDLTVREGEGGLVGTLLNLPGAPSLALDIDGTGPLDDYRADIDLRSDGVQRLAGGVTLVGIDDGLRFAADLGGDLTPLIAPQYADFFGPDVRLAANGLRGADGALSVERLEVTARSLDLDGALQLNADGRPVAFDLTGTLADPEGGAVTLPVGTDLSVGNVALNAQFDEAEGEAWTLDLQLRDLDLPAAEVSTLTLSGGGTITDGPAVTADLTYRAAGLALADTALAAALGDEIGGAAELSWAQGAPLSLSSLSLGGADYGLGVTGNATFENRSVQLDGEAALTARDLSRFSALTGQDLTGEAEVRLAGNGDVLGGLFDVSLDLSGTGVSIGQDVADRFLDGPVTLAAAARRDTSGTYLDSLTLDSRGLGASAQGAVGSGLSDLTFTATLRDMGLVSPELEGSAVLEGSAREEVPGLWDVAVAIDGPYALDADVSGLIGTGDTAGQSDVTLRVALPDIAPLVDGVSGPVTVQGRAAEADAPGAWQVDLAASAPEDVALTLQGRVGGGAGDVRLSAEVPDIAAFVPGVPGALSLSGTAQEETGGRWRVNLDAGLPYAATAAIQGVVGATESALSYSARLPDIAALVPSFSGAVSLTGRAAQTPAGRWQVDASTQGPYAATADVSALVGAGANGAGRTEVTARVAVPNVAPLAPGLTGALNADVTANQQESGAWAVDADATGPYRSVLAAQGTVGGGETNATLSLSLPDISPLAPSFAGAASLDATLRQPSGAPIDVTAQLGAPYGITATVEGQVGMGQGDLRLSADIPSVSPFAPQIRGGVQLTGTATERPEGWGVDIRSNGPGAAAASVVGIVSPEGSNTSLRAQGTMPLGLANGILAPQRVDGDMRFDLALDGPPGLDALSGTISTAGTSFALTTLGIGFEDIGLTANLAGGRATLSASARSTAGGGLQIEGPVGLSAPFDAGISVTLDNLVLEDPALFRTTLNGTAGINGALTGGATISSRIEVGETELRIPSGGVGFGGSIPPVQHVAEPGAVLLTRERAGLVDEADDGAAAGGGAIYNLDLGIDAPRQIFLRGRGLDVEMGGALRVGGTTAVPRPIGGIEVIRGRLDILGKRLDLSQDGRITLGGDLVPFLDLLATSDSNDLTIGIAITGPVDDPDFTFTSSPPLPEDEILAQFFFGKGLDNLSPVQAVQLAASIASLTGQGGGTGVLSGLREGLGVDDFNIVTDDNGEAALQIGQYLTDDIYTDVTTSSGGLTEFNVNIDLTDNITVRGSTDSEGETGLGIFFQRDY